MEVRMKKIFFALFVLNMEANCMREWEVSVDVVHKGVKGAIVARVAANNDNVKLLNYTAEEKDQVNLSEEKDSLAIVVSREDSAAIGIYSSEDSDNSLLSFTLRKEGDYMPAKAEFVHVSPSLRAVFYRPSMGGGDNFVLAIGYKESDVSIPAVQQAQTQHLSYLQMYFAVNSVIGQAATE